MAISLLGVVVCAATSTHESMELLTTGGDRVNVTGWGTNSLRIRIGLGGSAIVDKPGALIPPGDDNKGYPVLKTTSISHTTAATLGTFVNGNIQATVSADGMVTVFRVSDGAVVLREVARTYTQTTLHGNKAGPQSPPAPTWYTVAVNNSKASCSGGPCCLDVTNWHTEPGSNVAVSNCHWDGKDSNQRWVPDVSTGHLTVSSCGLCLTAGSTQLEIDTCGPSNVWILPAIGAAGPIKDKATGKCLQPAKGIDGGKLEIVACSSSEPLQQWIIEVAGASPPPPPPPPPQPPHATEVFESSPDERIYGFGEHQQGNLNNKGLSYDMESCLEYGKSHGGEVCLPFILSAASNTSRVPYGFLWNMPNYGGVAFGSNTTSWTAQAATQIDYFITIGNGDFESIMHAYVDAVGHVPLLPEYAAGYWHSKNRYSTQAELLAAAQTFHNLGINVSIIVIDYHSWKTMGDWSFDEQAWPDVPQMMSNLTGLGMKVMLSVWPFTAVNSSSISEIEDKGWAVTVQGTSESAWWDDNNCDAKCLLYDATQEGARSYVWSRLAAGYYKYGIKIFWLDASEPEISTADAQKTADFYNNSLGTGQETGMMFPYFHTRMIHDGLVSEGETDVIMLTRSAWAGMQRWGAALWSGDTSSHWASLKVSVQAGLNTQLSGIAWWTTDIGGYSGGDPSSPEFRELIVRWFEFGVTCPLFRQHGARNTEPWLLGNETLALVAKIIAQRYTWHEYIMAQMTAVSQTGKPVNRPLWFDFPHDPMTWDITTSYMFGDTMLVAPVTDAGVSVQTAYLPIVPSGSHWRHIWTNKTFPGGANATVPAPLGDVPIWELTSAAPM